MRDCGHEAGDGEEKTSPGRLLRTGSSGLGEESDVENMGEGTARSLRV